MTARTQLHPRRRWDDLLVVHAVATATARDGVCPAIRPGPGGMPITDPLAAEAAGSPRYGRVFGRSGRLSRESRVVGDRKNESAQAGGTAPGP